MRGKFQIFGFTRKVFNALDWFARLVTHILQIDKSGELSILLENID